jgi:hypothetical protein
LPPAGLIDATLAVLASQIACLIARPQARPGIDPDHLAPVAPELGRHIALALIGEIDRLDIVARVKILGAVDMAVDGVHQVDSILRHNR